MSTDSLRCRASLLFPVLSALLQSHGPPLLLAETSARHSRLGVRPITLAVIDNRWLAYNGL